MNFNFYNLQYLLNKKIKLWVLVLILIIFLLTIIFYGAILRHHFMDNKSVSKYVKLQKLALSIAKIPHNLKHNKYKKDEVVTLPRHEDKAKFKVYKKSSTNAILVLPRYDHDLKIAVVEIIDLKNFKILHTYKPNIKSIFLSVDYTDPQHQFNKKIYRNKPTGTRNPVIMKDGALVGHINYSPLFKIDICSNLIWLNQEEQFRHKISLDQDDNIWVSSLMYPYSKYIAEYKKSYGLYYDDAITKISQDGEILYIKSVSEILIENGKVSKNLLDIANPIYLNDVEPVLETTKYWEQGDVFISIKTPSAIIHFRPSTNKIINYLKGPFYMQHDVNIVSDKEISIFNNNNQFESSSKYSEILIYNFETKKYSKKFNTELKNENFKTETSGIGRVLKDGSLFLEEQVHGRLLFFNKFGEKEWEYVNKSSNGKVYSVNWSRIIEDKKLIEQFKKKLTNKKCS